MAGRREARGCGARRRGALRAVALILVGVATGCSSERGVAPDPTSATSSVAAPAAPAGSVPRGLAAAAETAGSAGGLHPPPSIVALLDQIPSSVVEAPDMVFLTYSDLARASSLAGLVRPATDAPGDIVAAWATAVAGTGADVGTSPTVAALLPQLALEDVRRCDEIRAEIGWAIPEVEVFLEEAGPPGRFLVAHGPEPERVADVLGDGRDRSWRFGSGGDLRLDPAATTAARPLGAPLSQSFRGGDEHVVAVSTLGAAVEQWLDGDGPTLGADGALVAVAGVLDAAGVYAAQLATSPVPPAGAANPYDAVAVGLASDAAGPMAVLAYHYADVAAAAAARVAIERTLTEGASTQMRRQWSELVTLEQIAAAEPADVEGSGDAGGGVVSLRLRFVDGAPPSLVWSLIPSQDSLTSQR